MPAKNNGNGNGINWQQLIATTAVSALVSVVVSQAYMRFSEQKARERERGLERELENTRLERMLAATNPAHVNPAPRQEPEPTNLVRSALASLLAEG